MAPLKRAEETLESQVEERTASLREALSQLEEFSYTVSHDLRAPLRAMQGYSSLLLTDHAQALEPEARHFLGRIADSATRLDKMILDVLTFSRVARAELSIDPLALQPTLAVLLKHYPNLQPPHATIQVDCPHTVLAHEPSLVQALSNLLNNAVKFVAPGVHPLVRIRSEQIDGQVRLTIQDNGIGIPPELQNRLFNMFERVHANGKYEGTGVGLAIVRKAIERMNGRVGLQSDGRTGCVFWIELPAAPETR